MKNLYKYLRKHFPNSTITIRYEITSYSEPERYSAYIGDTTILGQYSWSPDFTTIKELNTYCREKVKLYISNNLKNNN